MARALTEEQVRRILTTERTSCADLAKQYGVTHNCIHQVRQGMVFKAIWREMRASGELCPAERMRPDFVPHTWQRKLSAEAVREIVLSPHIRLEVWSAKLKMNRSALANVRRGVTYRDVHAAIRAEKSGLATTEECGILPAMRDAA